MDDATFEISADGKAITCKKCGRTSHNENDVRHKFCGHCKIFHGKADYEHSARVIQAGQAMNKLIQWMKENHPETNSAVFIVVPGQSENEPSAGVFSSNLPDAFLVKMLRHCANQIESNTIAQHRWTETGNSQ